PALIAAGDPAGPRAASREGGRVPPSTTQGLRALYVALTRPTRRLAVVHSAELPEGLAAG
ncbi:MAG: hypothetical protein ACRDWE_10210, partial [Acidimicrobiales bacterium]